MLINNLKFIIRRLVQQKTHTLSHILGLTIGITTCMFIGLFISYELSFDNYHQKVDRIYRVNQVWKAASYGTDYQYSAPAPLAAALRENIPSIETVASAYPRDVKTIEVNPNKLFNQEGILFAEADLLNIFDFEIIAGNAYEALRQPWQAVLTESTAQKFFGGENPIGKNVIYDGKHTLTVAAIIKDLPDNFHLPASMLVSYLTNQDYMGFNMSGWGFTFGASTYILLKEGVEPSALTVPIQAIYDKYANTDPKDPEISSADLQPLSKIHLEPKYDSGGEWVQAISPRWLWFFGWIGIIVLFLACVNFINLTTAQSLLRSKEVAVRKAIGANRQQLIFQFMGEASLLILIATLIAILITNFTLPYLNDQLQKALSFNYLLNGNSLLIFFGSLVMTILLTGLYPAWIISKFQPAISLKGTNHKTNKGSNLLRKALVTTQFAVSGTMLIVLFFISQQLNLFYTKNMGFDRDNIILLRAPDESQYGTLASALRQVKAVDQVSFMSGPPSQLDHNTTEMKNYGDTNPYPVKMVLGDNHYAHLFGLKLLAGRHLEVNDTSASSLALPSDQRFPKVLVNEQLVKVMNFESPENAIGKRFKIGWNDWQPEIVGVVEDFVTNSLHDPIQSTVMFQQAGFYNSVGIKIKANSNIAATLVDIQSAWKEAFPKYAYDFEFLDDRIDAFYKSESHLFSFFRIFAVMAILISCLGLWGLATHAALQRTKEIGIRKVLGASVFGVIRLISKEFLKLVGLSVLLAIPVAWYLTHQWLLGFAHRIHLNWWVFAISGLLVIIVALMTMSIQSIKAALANPIDSIRQE